MYSKEQIEKLYNEILDSYNKNLKSSNVKMPKLYRKNEYTLNSLVLIYLYDHMGKVVSKQELTSFLRTMGHDVNDVQQARHLAQQSGFYILSGTRGDLECVKYNIQAGEYMLKTLDEVYPAYKNLKRNQSLGVSSWEELKKKYHYRCVTCGSKEGEEYFLYPGVIVKLEKGHKDPSKPLEIANTIPQCYFCNQASRNYFVFDNKGRVEKIYDPRFVLKSDEEVQVMMMKVLIESHYELAKKIIDKYDE